MSGIVGNPGSTRSGKVQPSSAPLSVISDNWTAFGGLTANHVEFVGSNGVNLTHGGNGTYGGIRLNAKYKYFCMGYDAMCDAGSYWGGFWSNDSATVAIGSGITGLKTAWINSSSYAIRDLDGNSNQTSYNPGRAPDDGTWHHHQIEVMDTNYAYVHVDGLQRVSMAHTPPTYGGYLGLMVYNRGNVKYRNITIFEGAQLMDHATG